MKELIEIQNELKVLKQNSKNGIQFKYRTCEEIFQEVKPLCKKYGVALIVSDEVVLVGERYYIKATATVKKDGQAETATGFAREPDKLMSMSLPQITGSCSSYARKTAMGGLFNLDDNHDPDTDDGRKNKVITNSKLADDAQRKTLDAYKKKFQDKGDVKSVDYISDSLVNPDLTYDQAETVIKKAKVAIG